MEESFYDWNQLKIKLQNTNSELQFHERDIWLSTFGLNLGREENGKSIHFLRPAIVFKKFNTDTFWAIPLTSTDKSGSYYFSFPFQGRISVAILSQIRIFDRKRLWRKMGIMDQREFSHLKQKFKRLIE